MIKKAIYLRYFELTLQEQFQLDSILYLDLDLYKPTYKALVNLWDNVVEGGLIIFDEYGYHNWSESQAVDRFIKEKG